MIHWTLYVLIKRMIVTYMQVWRISISTSSRFLFLIIQLFEPKYFLPMTIDVCSYKSFTRTRFNRWTQERLREIVCGDCVLTRTIKMWNCSKNECMVYHILYSNFSQKRKQKWHIGKSVLIRLLWYQSVLKSWRNF